MIPTLEDIIRGLADGSMTKEVALRYLAEHVKLQEEVDSLSDVPYHRGHVTADLLKKCEEQDLRWGTNVYPSFDLALTSSADTSPGDLAVYHSLPTARDARIGRHESSLNGDLTWIEILTCELSKTTERYEDKQGLRDQLVDVAAVAVQWAAQLDAELLPEPRVTIEDNHDDETGTITLTAHVELDHEGPERGP